MTKLPKQLEQMIEQKASNHYALKGHRQNEGEAYKQGATELALAVLAEAEKVVEALEDIEVLHTNESTKTTCCEMVVIAQKALADWQKFAGGGE